MITVLLLVSVNIFVDVLANIRPKGNNISEF